MTGFPQSPVPRPSRLRWAWIPAIAYTVLIVVLSAQPYLASPQIRGIRLNDKLLHMLEYVVFSFLWCRALLRRDASRGAVLKWLAWGMLFAVSDEIHQSFVPHRQASVFDWLADTMGLIAGVGLFLALRRQGWRRKAVSAKP